MLTLSGPNHRYCDGIKRRLFLQAGSLAVGGLTLPGLLRAESAADTGSPQKSVIMVYLSGGLSHQDTFDLKPLAPKEIRGEFNPIPTSVPGIEFGEHLPRLAQVADKCAIIRSVVGQRDEHSSFQSLCGSTMSTVQREGLPNFGSVVAKVQGPTALQSLRHLAHRPARASGPPRRIEATDRGESGDLSSTRRRRKYLRA